ncbi:hypothetical protein Ocin01_20077 [Orchesella cincta]|uniref:MARVEL domain-containing protein n=1 Tax=Orchesella cincta TaxID=48709 RepID=A0A1D2M0X3_ORCCI|nr:hypothetical protein Ocin01_20077 [Orchesella cincta]
MTNIKHKMGLDLNSPVGLLKLGTVILGLTCFVTSFVGYFNNSDFAYPDPDYFYGPTEEERCKDNSPPTSCPHPWLATISIIIICIAFCLSFIMLIVLLFIDIDGPCKTIDAIGHIIAGILMILAAIFLFVYATEHYKYRKALDRGNKRTEQREFPTGFIITGIFCLVDGIIYIVAGVFIFKG